MLLALTAPFLRPSLPSCFSAASGALVLLVKLPPFRCSQQQVRGTTPVRKRSVPSDSYIELPSCHTTTWPQMARPQVRDCIQPRVVGDELGTRRNGTAQRGPTSFKPAVVGKP